MTSWRMAMKMWAQGAGNVIFYNGTEGTETHTYTLVEHTTAHWSTPVDVDCIVTEHTQENTHLWHAYTSVGLRGGHLKGKIRQIQVTVCDCSGTVVFYHTASENFWEIHRRNWSQPITARSPAHTVGLFTACNCTIILHELFSRLVKNSHGNVFVDFQSKM